MALFRKRDVRDLDATVTPERVSKSEKFGRWSEAIARGMGTPSFLVILTVFCGAWLLWNTMAPEEWRFDSAAIGFTALTLILSLQASYAAPMILLAQNRQDDRERVHIEQDRQRAERNLADTEFLAREVVALRLALKDLPDRDWVRQELKSLLEEMQADAQEPEPQDAAVAEPDTREVPKLSETAPSQIETNPLTGRLDIVTDPPDKHA